MRKDFLRHIVNRVLADSGENLPRQVIDDVRKFVSKAEEKYRFSAFGGSVSNLAKYLSSSDFDDLVTILRSAGGLDVLRRILEEARSSYGDLKDVVAAIDRRLSELGAGAEGERSAQERLRALLERLPWVRSVELEGGRVVARGKDVELVVEISPSRKGRGVVYELLVRGEAGDPSDLLRSLSSRLRDLV